MQRRRFLWQGAVLGAGFMGLQQWACKPKAGQGEALTGEGLTDLADALSDAYSFRKYGPLVSDPKGVMHLPEGFNYRILSTVGDPMDDGYSLPGAPDGMAAFADGPDHCLVVRNHEMAPNKAEEGPFAKGGLDGMDPAKCYDFGKGEMPGLGGTTTFRYNLRSGEIERQHLSLAGTIRNCAGGATPWGSWLSCEEDVSDRGVQGVLEQNHGYVFEVPARAEGLVDPVPIRAMGRFNHEAVVVDPRTGICYLTEDRHDSCLYRYIPKTPGKLHEGGQLQALMLSGRPKADARNWDPAIPGVALGERLTVDWIDLPEVETPDDSLRHRAQEMGAAAFARGEGIWFGDDGFYFACTNGGSSNDGQIFRMHVHPGSQDQLELFVEPNDSALMSACDNLTIAPNGDIVLCEDRPSPRIVGITPQGELYPIAHNVGHESEFAGACFSPDGSTLFVNIQVPGLTLAIQGPWKQQA